MAPDSRLARRVLPAPLHQAVTHVFAQRISGCMLVGGTALSGYYAGHRRSDDLDLFARDEGTHQAAILAVRSLDALGVQMQVLLSSAQFFRARCDLAGHSFTVDVVLDPNLHVVGESHTAGDGVSVASVETLLKQKAATLVSRCSEKDLYDLIWLFRENPEVDLSRLIELGSQIDSGLTAESAITSIVGTMLSVSACGFSVADSAEEVLAQITALKNSLLQSLERMARTRSSSPIGALVRALRK